MEMLPGATRRCGRKFLSFNILQMAGIGGNTSCSFISNPSLVSLFSKPFLVMVVSLVQNRSGIPDAFSLFKKKK